MSSVTRFAPRPVLLLVAALAGLITVLAAAIAMASSGWLASPVVLSLEARAISATDFGFAPAEIVAPPNVSVSVRLTNTSSAPHTLVFLDPVDRRSGAIIEPGQSDRLAFTTPGPGTYRFVCTVHEGMSGVLIVR